MKFWIKIDCKGQAKGMVDKRRYAVYGIIVIEGEHPADVKVFGKIIQALNGVEELNELCVG